MARARSAARALISCACVWPFAFALLLLVANMAARLLALSDAGPLSGAIALAIVGAGVACLVRPSWLGAGLTTLGVSCFLCGFHSYGTRSQLFELAVTVLASIQVLRLLRGPRPPQPAGMAASLPFAVLYAAAATLSLVLLPVRVLEHRLFVEGPDIARALLGAFPKDPLYPIASVDRLWLFLAFVASLAMLPGARGLYRQLVRGVAWGALAAVALGLLDFAGFLPLARYNQSHLFFGADYRRLQSTFGNPSWFACFVACALPFVLLEWNEARRGPRLLLAVLIPLVPVSLFLSGSRASWLVACLLLAGIVLVRLAARRSGRPLASLSRLDHGVLAASLLAFALLAAGTYGRSDSAANGGHPERLEGLSRELRLRGLGLQSPRRVAAEYALRLAQERPLLGLGYESFNMHLRAQLALPASPVARVVNTAVGADPTETMFDDSHNTYLQVLTGTGALGLVLWLALAGMALAVGMLVFLRSPGPVAAAVVLGMLAFHVYGLFQGMAYLPATFFLFFVALGHAMALASEPLPDGLVRASRAAALALGALVVLSIPLQLLDRGYRSLKRSLAVERYLPDEIDVFEGFYPPEAGPAGAFRWSRRRAIVNVERAAPFRLAFTCGHPDLEREPVIVSLQLEGGTEDRLVCRPGPQELRFDPAAPGALRLRVSRTFRPGASDRRELGVAVSEIRWE
jgi:O-Antigen ligase